MQSCREWTGAQLYRGEIEDSTVSISNPDLKLNHETQQQNAEHIRRTEEEKKE
jgi:hypothetical protein